MKIVENEAFLTKMAAHGIHLDTRFGAPQCLMMENERRLALPFATDSFKSARLIEVLWRQFADGCYVWKRGGVWKLNAPQYAHYWTNAYKALLEKLAPIHGPYTLHVEPDDWNFFGLILTGAVLGASSVSDDLFLVAPDGARLVWVDHDGYLFYSFRKNDSLDPFYVEMLEFCDAPKPENKSGERS